jgi:hypothetical protein
MFGIVDLFGFGGSPYRASALRNDDTFAWDVMETDAGLSTLSRGGWNVFLHR